MPTPYEAASTDLSNIVAIHDAAFAIARDSSGVSWAGSRQWDFPTIDDVLADGGYPFLVVTWPEFVGYGAGPDDTNETPDDAWEMWFNWDIGVYALAPYSYGVPEVYSTPIGIGALLKQAFTRFNTLNGTCDTAKAGRIENAKLYERDASGNPKAGPPLYFSSSITLRVSEIIETDFTNIA